MSAASPSIDQRKASVRQHLTMSSVVEKHIKLSGSAGSAKRRGQCPFHGSSSASFALFKANSGEGTAYCFGCQWSGDMFKFLMDMRGIAFLDALAELEAETGIAEGGAIATGTGPVLRQRDPRPRRKSDIIEPIEMARWIWSHAAAQDDAVRRYMVGRGVPEGVLTTARLAAFRYLSDCPCTPWREGQEPRAKVPVAPAVIALVERPEIDAADDLVFEPLGIHVTYLNPDGTGTMKRRKPWARKDSADPWLPKRRMLGPVGSGAVILGSYSPDAPLFVGEGNETVLSGIAIGGGDERAVGIATLSLDNLQGGVKHWKGRTWPMFRIEGDVERPPLLIPRHRGKVVGLIDADMKPLRGMRDRDTGAFLGERVVERRGGPIVRRPISGAERSRICEELFTQAWRRNGSREVRTLRPKPGQDFNDAAASEVAA